MNLTFFCPGRADWSAMREIVRLAEARAEMTSRVVVCSDFDFIAGEAKHESLASPIVAVGGETDVTTGAEAAVAIGKLTGKLLPEMLSSPPDCLVVAGDRYELLAALAVAVPLRIPLAHISGGDCTFGALDEQIRHAVTKAAHLHFVANELFASRVRWMGEEAWRIHVTGDPGLDRIQRADFSSAGELEELLRIRLDGGCVLVAFHPVTNDPESTWSEWKTIAHALEDAARPVVVTGCNADPQGAELRAKQEAWGAGHPDRRFVAHLGQRNFLGLLRAGACLIGNSSAGLWEAPSLGAPAINVGFRQEGRLRAANVIDVPQPDVRTLHEALHRALDPAFREEIRALPNPYGDGASAPRIIEALGSLPPRAELLRKRFVDSPTCN